MRLHTLYVKHYYARLHNYYATVIGMRIGLSLTDEDLALLKELKAELAKTHGQLSTTAIVRMGLRALQSRQ